MFNKLSYFQGTEEPTPKKKKYKSDKAIVDQTRFKEPLYRNYDLYETEGVDGPAKLGPGGGLYQNMDSYKSVSDFLKKKRKRNSDKYKADDSWIEDNGSKTKIAFRRKFLEKLAIDFPIDSQITPILGDSGTVSDSVPIGGQMDEYLPLNDFEGKSPEELNFGRDYTDGPISNVSDEMEKIINPAENDLFGLPDGVDSEELDADKTKSEYQEYGTTNSGNTLYNNI